jgi:hypothetical protein
VSVDAGPPTPNPWSFWGRVYAPTCTATCTGMANATTYEVQISAEDSSVQEGARSEIAEVTPRAVSIRHTPRKRLGAG